MTRRDVLLSAGAALQPGERIIDIHQHTNYSGRSNADLVAHQRKLGVTRTVLLPAGSRYGLAAQAFGNDSVVELAKQYPKEFLYFANELPDIPEADAVIRRYLKLGAIGIGEQKFPVTADSVHIEKIAGIAKEFGVPVLLHFQHGEYNLGIEKFHRILEKYPTVNFIGHAQTWWGNIDQKHDQTVMYPKTPVTRGGITDRYLTDYPNMYGDLSAGSGLNSLLRDEDHARGFIERHQNKLLFGSDCSDTVGEGEKCLGARIIQAVRRLSPSETVVRKLLHDNATKLLKLRS
jgi:predicted TIM-barrel fold metal-dependent hydrolase